MLDDEVGCEVDVVTREVVLAELVVDEPAELLPLVVAIRATTIPIASTLAIAMMVFALELIHSAYAGAVSARGRNCRFCDSVSVEFRQEDSLVRGGRNHMHRRKSVKVVFAAVASLALLVPATAGAKLSTTTQKAVEKVGKDAYTFGYAPVYMNTSVARFPANQLINVRYLATDQTKSIVKPNADTLYTIAVLDVGSDPIIVHTPATGSRYFGLELVDSYTNVFGYIGNRVTGNAGGDYAIVGPTWSKTKTPLRKTVKKVIVSSTPRLWVIGRTLIDGPSDLAAVTSLQDQISMQLNSKVGTSTYLGCINSILPGQLPKAGCFGMQAATSSVPPAFPQANLQFFKDFGAITKSQPPLAQDKSLMTALKKYGVGPGLDPAKTQSADIQAALVKGAQTAQAAIDSGVITAKNRSLTKNNGWILFDGVGDYKKDYLTRAIIAEFGLGANVPAEAVYPAAISDSAGRTLNGSAGAKYRIHFAAGQLPKTTSAFWSITLYGEDQYFVANSINRFAIGDRTAGLTTNTDGSTDIYISAAEPTTAEHGTANWLPAPTGQFNLMLRIYRPTTAVLNGTWKYPRIEKIS